MAPKTLRSIFLETRAFPTVGAARSCSAMNGIPHAKGNRRFAASFPPPTK